MKKTILTVLILGAALGACGEAEAEGDAAGASSSGSADVADGLISCQMPDYGGTQGVTVTQSFIFTGGKVKRYSEFENAAFDLCEAGQEGCSLGVENGTIKMDYTSPNGTKSLYHVDLGSMRIEAWEGKPGEDLQSIDLAEGTVCTRAPLPEGLTVN